jgi:ABC-2 type transport system permease protein
MRHKSKFRAVMRFEFMNYMRNKVYIGITIALVLLIAIGLSIPAIIEGARAIGLDFSDKEKQKAPEEAIHVIDQTGWLDLTVLEQALPDERWVPAEPGKADELIEQVDQQKIGAVLILETLDSWRWVVRRVGMNSGTQAMVQAVLNEYYSTVKLSQAGLSPSEIESIMKPAQWTVEETVEESGKTMEQTYLYTYLLLFLLYMTVMMYGQMVATSVASEKSNRAMELLITSARPIDLMFGKVIGSGLAGMTQIALLLLTTGIFYQVNAAYFEHITVIQNIFHMPLEIILYTLIFYLTGYFSYAFLYGALGSLASRTEDINTSIMPILLLFMAAFFISFAGMMNPDASFLTVFSFVPFISPMAMFVRISMPEVSFISILISILIQVLSIWFTGYLAARIYRMGVLMYGKPPRIRTLIRMLKNAR